MAKASISRAWEDTRAIATREGRLLAAVALALLVLPGLVGDMILPTPKAGVGGMPDISGPRVAGLAIILLISMVGQLALIRLASGDRTTVGGAIGHAARRTPVYVAALLIWMLPFVVAAGAIASTMKVGDTASPGAGIAALGLLILVLGFIFVFVRMLMTGPVASNEPVGPVAVVRRSWDLTRGNWLRLFGFFILFFVVLFVVMIVIGAVVGSLAQVIFGNLDSMTVGAFLVSLVSQTVGAVLQVLLSVMLARIYVQLTGGAANVSEVFE